MMRTLWAYRAGRHRIRRLMRLMGIGIPAAAHQRGEPGAPDLPLLLRDLVISRGGPRVVRGDQAYVPEGWARVFLPRGSKDLGRPVDEAVLAATTNTMDASFCVGALGDALVRATPSETDPTQFTSEAFATGCGGRRTVLDGDQEVPRQLFRRLSVAEVRGRVAARASRGGRTDRSARGSTSNACARTRRWAGERHGRGLSRKHGGACRTIRHHSWSATGATTPGAWRDCRAPAVP